MSIIILEHVWHEFYINKLRDYKTKYELLINLDNLD